MSRHLRLAGVSPATCLDHAVVRLECPETGDSVSVRVDASSARALLGETNGIAGENAVFVDIAQAIAEAHGSRIEAVEIALDAEPFTGKLFFNGEKGRGGIQRLPAGVLLVLAARLDLPVRVSSYRAPVTGAQPIAQSVREFIEGLDFDGPLAR